MINGTKSFNSKVDSSTCPRSWPKYLIYTSQLIVKLKTIVTVAALVTLTDAVPTGKFPITPPGQSASDSLYSEYTSTTPVSGGFSTRF